MSVKPDVRKVQSKKNKDKTIEKKSYKCEGSYVDINGTPHRYHKRGFVSSDEAKNWERAFLIKVKEEVPSNMTFGDLYGIYMNSKKGIIKDRSYYDMDNTFNKHILPYWGKIKLDKITLKSIEKYQSEFLLKCHHIDSKYSNRTMSKIQTAFKSALRYGFTNGYIKDQRIFLYKTYQRSDQAPKEMQFWHPNEYAEFIKVIDEPIYIALFNVLYWCGLRIGEALALTWKDVNLTGRTISITKSYTKHTRQVTTPIRTGLS